MRMSAARLCAGVPNARRWAVVCGRQCAGRRKSGLPVRGRRAGDAICCEDVMILTMTLFTLWFGFSSYVHREVDGALYWIVSTINSFVLLRFVILVGEIENRWHASCIFFAVLGASLAISFVFKKLKTCSRAEGSWLR